MKTAVMAPPTVLLLEDVTPFVREMRDALRCFEQTRTADERRAAQAEMKAIMLRHFPMVEWRDRRRRRMHRRGERIYSGSIDRKLLAAGPDED